MKEKINCTCGHSWRKHFRGTIYLGGCKKPNCWCGGLKIQNEKTDWLMVGFSILREPQEKPRSEPTTQKAHGPSSAIAVGERNG